AAAVLGNQASTQDPAVLEHFNAIRTRAGVPPVNPNDTQGGPTEVTWQMIFEERMKEFAMESMAWYDLVRLSYYDAQKAYDIINAQDRGLFVAQPYQCTNPTAWPLPHTSLFAQRYANSAQDTRYLPFP